MGVMAKIAAGDISERLPKKNATEKNAVENNRPEKSADSQPGPSATPNAISGSSTTAACPAPGPERSASPTAPCKCGSVQFWRDAYGGWHCGACEFPRVLSLVRETRDVPNGADTFDFEGQVWAERRTPGGGRRFDRV